MKTKLATAILLASMLHVGHVSALGLGDIDVASQLNQHFEAEIPFVNADGLDPSQIIVGLASADDFERANLDRPYFLNSLEFRVQRDSRGRQVLKLTSPDVLREPYINFLLEVRWPSGRMLREYLVLLDLPIYGPSAAGVTAMEVSGQSAPSRNSVARMSARPSVNSASSGRQGSSYVVRNNDSLWKIARATMPEVDVNRAMLALKRENPSAFVGGDSNQLTRGAVLQIPSSNALREVSGAAANQAASVADSNWRGSVATPSKSSAAPVLPKRNNDSPQTAVSKARKAVANATDSPEVAQLQAELATSLESLDQAALENRSLVERIDEVESKFNDLERLLALKERELDSVQAALEQRQALLDDAAASAVVATQTAAADVAASVDERVSAAQAPAASSENTRSTTDTSFAADTGSDTGSDAASAANSLVDEAMNNVAAPAKPAALKASEPAESKGLLQRAADALSTSVTGLLVAMAGLGVVLAGLLAWLFGRKNDDYTATVFDAPEVADFAEDDQGEFEPAAPTENTVAAVATSVPVEAVEEAEEAFDPQFERSFDGSDELDAVIPDASEAEASGGDLPEDPIAEADIYLAYGRNDQAVAMLERAIEQDALRTDLRLKLLEVYDEIGDAAQVEIQKAQILTLDPTLEGDIAELLGGAALGVSDGEMAGDLALDLDGGLDSTPDSGLENAVAAISSEDLEDEVATKLDLARAYLDMGDYDGAREILSEVVEEGSDTQRDVAREMLEKFG